MNRTNDRHCRHFLVSGRVQGVFYRASTQARARELQLQGFVRNLTDGRVEVVACGDETAIAALQNWLWQGPPQAQVGEVFSERVDSAMDYVVFEVL